MIKRKSFFPNKLTSPQKTLAYEAHFFFGAAAPIWALAYLHETLRFTSVF
jgi:hypothetical protein